MPRRPSMLREPPLDGPELKAALAEGLRAWMASTNNRLPDFLENIVNSQMVAIARSCRRAAPARMPAGKPDAAWWDRD